MAHGFLHAVANRVYIVHYTHDWRGALLRVACT